MATFWHGCFTYATTSPYTSPVTKIDAPIWFRDVAHMCCPTNSKAKWSIPMFKYVIQ